MKRCMTPTLAQSLISLKNVEQYLIPEARVISLVRLKWRNKIAFFTLELNGNQHDYLKLVEVILNLWLKEYVHNLQILASLMV